MVGLRRFSGAGFTLSVRAPSHTRNGINRPSGQDRSASWVRSTRWARTRICAGPSTLCSQRANPPTRPFCSAGVRSPNATVDAVTRPVVPSGPRSISPFYQEIWAWLIVHYALTVLITRAAEAADVDPDRVSFTQALRIAPPDRDRDGGLFPLTPGSPRCRPCTPRSPASSTHTTGTAAAPARSNAPATTATRSRSPARPPAPAIPRQRPSASGPSNGPHQHNPARTATHPLHPARRRPST